MEEFEKLYTVADIAKMTSFTSRTIRNYLKNGILQGRKIGGQWRFTMENIKQLFSNSIVLGDMSRQNRQRVLNFLSGADTYLKDKIQVCTVIDCNCESPEAGQQIYEKLVTIINTKKDDSPAKFDYEFMPKTKKARFTLFGNPEFIIKNLQLL